MISYTIVRSNRKTIALYIRDGVVEVRAPHNIPKRVIDAFVASKTAWIQEKQASLEERHHQRAEFSLNYGDTVVYRGHPYPICAAEGHHAGFDDRGFFMPPGFSSEQIKKVCVQVYRMMAQRVLPARVSAYAERMGVTPAAVKISGAASRWGSCSSQRSLNFSWRLMMAGDDIIDYVIVHELSHITHMNHSDEFWALVEEIIPDYRECRQRLNDLSRRLNMEDWT